MLAKLEAEHDPQQKTSGHGSVSDHGFLHRGHKLSTKTIGTDKGDSQELGP